LWCDGDRTEPLYELGQQPLSEPGWSKPVKNELRKDYLLDRWVVFAPGRARRPADFVVSRSKAEAKICSFCPGNENLTPPARLLYVLDENRILKLRDVGGKRRSDWSVRCIPNLYPAFESTGFTGQGREQGRFPYVKSKAVGVHEIIIESPDHDGHPHLADEKQIALWLQAALERVGELNANWANVALFRNHGREAGASIAHAHSQIIATPLVPSRIDAERKAISKLRDETGDCAICKISSAEAKTERCITNGENFTVITPWASVFPFEFWIIPRRHLATAVGLTLDEVRDLARTIKISFKALANLLSDPPYNMIFHSAPSKSHRSFHWHIEVYPKLSVHAGFELGTGMYINTQTPESSAEALRAAVGS
jgi:UDPglucose--hexose-1-phosphate uridylyltransferase